MYNVYALQMILAWKCIEIQEEKDCHWSKTITSITDRIGDYICYGRALLMIL